VVRLVYRHHRIGLERRLRPVSVGDRSEAGQAAESGEIAGDIHGSDPWGRARRFDIVDVEFRMPVWAAQKNRFEFGSVNRIRGVIASAAHQANVLDALNALTYPEFCRFHIHILSFPVAAERICLRTAFALLLIESHRIAKPRRALSSQNERETFSAVGCFGGQAARGLLSPPPKAARGKEIAMRKGAITRKTKETSIEVGLDLDGSGVADIATGVGFFDHMLDQLARHSLVDITIRAEGDRHIDDHHTVEDVGIALGQALAKALGDKRGLARYADCLLPMDETLTRVALDVSGRPFLIFRTEFPTERIGAFDTELVREFFQAFAGNAGVTLHIETLYGLNSHHIAESCFKGVARALRGAIAIDSRQAERVPSTKGTL
jgi:imidazoleglycerol-phosphate dehydratase